MISEGLVEEVRSELGLENGFNWVKCRGSGKTVPGSGTSMHVALTSGWAGLLWRNETTSSERLRSGVRIAWSPTLPLMSWVT